MVISAAGGLAIRVLAGVRRLTQPALSLARIEGSLRSAAMATTYCGFGVVAAEVRRGWSEVALDETPAGCVCLFGGISMPAG